MTPSLSRARRGFTLVELLVSVALAITVLGLGVAVSQSSAFDSYKTVGSADRLSQWLLIAKNRALRDRAPRGVRLIPESATSPIYREAAYIETPDAWLPPTGGQLALVYTFQPMMGMMPAQVTNKQVFLSGVNFADFTTVVSAGDLLNLPDLGRTVRINTIADASGYAATARPAGATIELTIGTTPAENLALLPDLGAGYSPTPMMGNPPTAAYATRNFGIYRAPRPLLGEPNLQISSGMGVDSTASQPAFGTTMGTNMPFDILFAPSGEVIGTGEGLFAFVLRDVNRVATPATQADLQDATKYDTYGQMILVCIYPKTGAIATQPVAPPSLADPFKFAKDGINTGL